MIYIPEKCGLCGGAKRALNLAYATIENNKQNRVVLYKELLHNPYIMEKCMALGCVCIDDFNDIKEGDIVIVRAHGETKEFFEKINDLGVRCVDGTCPTVKNVEKLIHEAYHVGEKIVIVGKKEHPEVKSSNGWCENTANIISSTEEAHEFYFENDTTYHIIAQTTFNSNLVEEIYAILEGKGKKEKLIFHDTVCKAQNSMHDEAIKMLEKIDILFIVGGKDSSNTKAMFAKCVEKGQVDCYHVNSVSEFESLLKSNDSLLKYKDYGIAGGASTTYEEIVECKMKLEVMLNNVV